MSGGNRMLGVEVEAQEQDMFLAFAQVNQNGVAVLETEAVIEGGGTRVTEGCAYFGFVRAEFDGLLDEGLNNHCAQATPAIGFGDHNIANLRAGRPHQNLTVTDDGTALTRDNDTQATPIIQAANRALHQIVNSAEGALRPAVSKQTVAVSQAHRTSLDM